MKLSLKHMVQNAKNLHKKKAPKLSYVLKLFILPNVQKIVYLHILWCLIHPWTRSSDQRQTPVEAHKMKIRNSGYKTFLKAVQIHDCLTAVRLTVSMDPKSEL